MFDFNVIYLFFDRVISYHSIFILTTILAFSIANLHQMQSN